MRNRSIILGPVSVLVIAALLLAGCGKTAAPTTAPPTTAPATTAPPATTGAAPTTSPATTAPTRTAPATTVPAATTSPATTAPATVPADMARVTLKKLDGTTMQKQVRKPKYGGTLAYIHTDPLFFDETMGAAGRSSAHTTHLTNDALAQHDWTLGPAGTGERSFYRDYTPAPYEQVRPLGGGIAESVQFVDAGTVIFHIRKGVKFALNPNSEAATLVNGREVTANDVIATILRHWDAPKAQPTTSRYSQYLIRDELKALDSHTVQIKWEPGRIQTSWYHLNGAINIWPREVLEKYGTLTDWKNSVGSGPFILTDYIKANSATFVRNPNYWQKDPFFPENRLPYVDRVTQLYITDASTRMAAMRTGKVDFLYLSVTVDDFRSLTGSIPELKWQEVTGNLNAIFMRVDKPELPWYDKRVRQALSMAIDRETMKDQFYSGYAAIMDAPALEVNTPDWSELYVPLSSLPANVRELYEYHPDKAKQLLAEAGYPTGFKAEVLVSSTGAIDQLEVVQSDWAKIGVDLLVDMKESGTVSAMTFGRKYTQMYAGNVMLVAPYGLWIMRKGLIMNFGNIDDPKVNEAGEQIDALWPDTAKQSQVYKSILPYVYEQRWWLPIVQPSEFAIWWPWLANFHGEAHSGFGGSTDYGVRYRWIDQELKKNMGK